MYPFNPCGLLVKHKGDLHNNGHAEEYTPVPSNLISKRWYPPSSRWYLVSLSLSSGHSSGAADRLTVFVFRDLPAYGLRYQLGKFGPVVLKIMPKFPREVANKKSHPCAHDSSYGALAHFWYYNQVRLPFVCEKITTHGSVTFDLDATARLCTVTRPVDTCIIWKSMHCSCTVLEDVHFGQVWFRVT